MRRDPLSLYLFLCINYLFKHGEARGDLRGVAVCWGAPFFSHLFFVNDSFLLCQVKTFECHVVQNIPTTYEMTLGLAINLHKLGILFNSNTKVHDRQYAMFILRVNTPLDHGRFLGLPLLVIHNKEQVFSFFCDRLSKRLLSRKKKLFYKRGKEIF